MKQIDKVSLSALVDGELEAAECAAAVTQLLSDSDSRERWRSYHLARDALAGIHSPLRGDFHTDLALCIAREPSIVAPNNPSKRRSLALTRGIWRSPWLGWAVAASVTAMTIIFSLPIQTHVQPAPTMQVAQRVAPATLTPDQARLSNYLVSHTEQSAAGRLQGILPYSRLTSLNPQ